MSSLALYRALVPEHTEALVPNERVTVWLELAAKRHTAARWGNVYPEAMVFWAAHNIEMLPGSGAPGAPVSGTSGPLISQKDGDLSRTYAQPSSSSTAEEGSTAWFTLSEYGQKYLDLLNTRESSLPRFVRPRMPLPGRCPWRG
jgi:hypothetical protein